MRMNSTWFAKVSFCSFLARTDHSDHLPVARVVHEAEVALVARRRGCGRFRSGLLKAKPGLEFPGHVLPVVRGDVAARLPCADHAIQRSLLVHFAMDRWRLHGSRRECLYAEIRANSRIPPKLGNVLRLIIGVDELLAPKIRRDTAEREAACSTRDRSSCR